jgi:hypothetical protein
MRRFLFTLLLCGLIPASASAVTVDQIVMLSKAGVAESVLLALIDRDRSVFSIEPQQLIALKQAGVSEAVVLAMLKSGRDRSAEAIAPPPEPVVPETIIIGHGPDVPDTAHRDAYAVASANSFVPSFWFIGPPVRNECVVETTSSTDPRLSVPPALGRRGYDQAAQVVVNCPPRSRGRHHSHR